MHQPSKWWTGLIPVAALWIASGTFVTSPVEDDILARARDVAATTSPDTAAALKMSVAGRDVRVEGPEFAKGQGAAIARAIAEATGVRLVAARFEPVAVASPYIFSATRAGDQFVLKGGVPSPVTRARLLEAAKSSAPKAEIVDALSYATGEPQGFEAIALRGLAEAARLEGGAFTLTDKSYAIAGQAPSSAIYEAAIASTQQLPAGATLGAVAVLAPEAKPFVWSATSDGVATTLSGVAPSIETRTSVARAATLLLPGRMIVDQMRIARGAPAGDFTAVTAYALNELGRLAKGRVVISDGAYTINGEATSTQAYEAALAATQKLPEGLTLARADILAPEVKPFVWSARNDGDAITLTGMAPTGAARAVIAEAASKLFPGRTIVNQMGIARGAPEGDFVAAATAAMTELGKLATGEARLVDARFSISGEAAADVTNEVVAASARARLAAPFEVASVDIKEMNIKPYVFSLAKTDGKVTLSGYAPDEKARRELLVAAKAAFFQDSVEDGLKIGKGAPANLVAALKSMFGPMARMSSGSLVVTDGDVQIDGHAIYAKAVDQIKTALSGALPAGFRIGGAHVDVAPPGPAIAPAQCQPLFNGLLDKGRILFDTGSANLSKDSLAVLDHLVDLAARCRDADIEVAGHTDTVGSADSNLDLSRRRAAAVVAYLADAGIETTRIASQGYGQTKPIASNDTAEGRAQNRRIEFLVK